MSSKVYQWTSEEQTFLDAYQAECDRYVAEFKGLANPSDPVRTFWTTQWNIERLEALGDKYKKYIDGWERYAHGYLEVVREGAFRIADRAEQEMREHYNQLVNAYQLPEPPKDIQHDKVIKIKAWKHLGRDGKDHEEILHQSVLLVGQIIIQTSLWRGEKTWEFVDGYRGMKLSLSIQTSGSREIKKAYEERAIRIAAGLSRLTNWEEVTSIPQAGLQLLKQMAVEVRDNA